MIACARAAVSWVMEHGDVRAFEGSWTLEGLGDGRTRATYAVRIDFGRKLGLLLRGPAGAAMRRAAVSSMPDKLKAFVAGRSDLPVRRQRRAA